MKTRRTSRLATAAAVAVISLLIGAGCASAGKAYHKYLMRGMIVKVEKKASVIVCVGKKQGAKKGQVLVVKDYREDAPDDFPAGAQMVAVGKIKIVKVFNEHMARAVIVSGKAPRGTMVELEP